MAWQWYEYLVRLDIVQRVGMVVKRAVIGVSAVLVGAAEWCKWRGNGTTP